MKIIGDSCVGPVRLPCKHRTGFMWRPTNYSNKPYVYSRVKLSRVCIAWCDHQDSTSVKCLQALHSALRKINRKGVKNLTGPLVGCGINAKDPSGLDSDRTRGVARILLGLKPSRDSRATSQRDSPIWIQPLRVFRNKIVIHSGYDLSYLNICKWYIIHGNFIHMKTRNSELYGEYPFNGK